MPLFYILSIISPLYFTYNTDYYISPLFYMQFCVLYLPFILINPIGFMFLSIAPWYQTSCPDVGRTGKGKETLGRSITGTPEATEEEPAQGYICKWAGNLRQE